MTPLYYCVGERDIQVIYSENGKTTLEVIPNNGFVVKLLQNSVAEEKQTYNSSLRDFYKELIEKNEV